MLPSNAQKPHFLRLPGKRVLTINLIATVLSMLLLVFVRGETGWFRLAVQFLYCLVYSFSIGTLLCLFLPHLPFDSWPFPWSWIRLMGGILFFTAVGCLLADLIFVAAGAFPRRDFWGEFYGSVRFGGMVALILGTSVFLYESLKFQLEQTTLQLRTKQLEEERARKLATEARLSSLESRLHPHFLFNTLNSISQLIHEDPRQADAMVERLASLLRFHLDAHPSSLVPLGQELKVIRDYLEIEKVRFGDRLRYSLEVPAELESVEIPPLSVQTLVENCVKHTVANSRAGAEIRVAAHAVEQRVAVEVSDDGPGFTLDSATVGHGLDNLLARLDTLFGREAGLEVLTRNHRTVVRMSLPHEAARLSSR